MNIIQQSEQIDPLTGTVISCAINVHKALGPGLLESVYEDCLVYELLQQGLHIRTQVKIPIVYKDVRLESGFRADVIVNDTLLLELKHVDELHPIHIAQVLTYLKLTNFHKALLINFNVKYLRDGIKRIVL